MRSRVATRLAWSLCALSLVLTVLSVLLLVLNYSHTGAQVYGYWPESIVIPIGFSIIGAIIASRLPANPLGWLFCAAAICFCSGAPQRRVRHLCPYGATRHATGG